MASDHPTAAFLRGRVLDAAATRGGIEGKGSTYTIEDEDGRHYRCDYTDVVTEGFRTLRPDDVVRFTPVMESPGNRARHVLKLNEPTTADLYGQTTEPNPSLDDGPEGD